MADAYGYGVTLPSTLNTVADTISHADDASVLSLRDAIDLANTTAGADEIWLPAWNFVLTLERIAASHEIERSISQGDLEVEETLTVRGVTAATKVAWRPNAVVDKVFELLGNYNNDGVIDGDPADVDSSDYVFWRNAVDSQDLRADGDDNGVVDNADYDLWRSKFGYRLTLLSLTT